MVFLSGLDLVLFPVKLPRRLAWIIQRTDLIPTTGMTGTRVWSFI